MVENRPRALEFNCASRNNQQRQRQKEQAETDRDVKRALQEVLEWTEAKTVGIEEPTGLKRLKIDRSGLSLPKIQEIDYLDASKLAVQELTNGQAPSIVSRHDDF